MHIKQRNKSIVTALLLWFSRSARDLPWRRTLDPYAVWVSEIMLQQTQVKTVMPYYDRWLKELPNIPALAEASSEKIHKLWEGLGYYTRVRNMQKAAQVMVEKHGGQFPRHFEDVLALPGIGRYTAGAITSIAFNLPAPILDGNVIRVLTRLFGIRENAREKETNARLWRLAEELVRAAEQAARTRGLPHSMKLSGPCSALNQSLMELGALICTPRQPDCGHCPLATGCAARRGGLTGLLPNLGERASVTARRFVACVVEHDGCFLIRQREAGVVNAHLWEFPNIEVTRASAREAHHPALEAAVGFRFAALDPLITIKHSITRYRITLEAFRAELKGRKPRAAGGRWVSRDELAQLPFTSAHRRVLLAATRAPFNKPLNDPA